MVNSPVSWNLVLCTTISVLLLLLNNEMTSSADKISPVGVKMCCLICKRHGNCKSTSYDEESLVCDTDSKQREGESFEDLCDNNEIPDACWKNQCGQKQQCLTTPRNEARCVPVTLQHHEHNRRSYNKSISQWSSKLPMVNIARRLDICVVKGLLILVEHAYNDIRAYTISNQTLRIACNIELELGNTTEFTAVHRFGNQVLVQYLGRNTMYVLNVDTKSLTLDYTIRTNVQYNLLAVADNTTFVGVRKLSEDIVDILTLNGTTVTLCRQFKVSGANFSEFMRHGLPGYLCVTNDLKIITTGSNQSIVCVDGHGSIKWNVDYNNFKQVIDIQADNHGNVFVVDWIAKNVIHLKQTGEYFKIIIPNSPTGRRPYSTVVDELGTLYVLTFHGTADVYMHVYGRFQRNEPTPCLYAELQ